MRLVDLHPKWIGSGGEGIRKADGTPAPRREGIGIMFDCPCGKPEDVVYVDIDPPLDGGPPLRDSAHIWQRKGDTFETLTLTPSIRKLDGCQWHGWVTNGEVKSC
jgi:hypothetical protein